MRHLTPFAPALVLAFAPCLLAQTPFVSAAHFATAEASSNNVYPFGATNTPFRYQQIHDDVPAMVITGLAFRHDNNGLGTLLPAFDVTIDAWISTATVPSSGSGSTFDLNHGLDKIQCVTNRVISIPANDPSRLPHAWSLDIPFDTSAFLVFAGAPASLCWEVHVTARSNTSSIPFDSATTLASTTSGPNNPPLAATRAGTGCVATGQTQPIQVAPTSNPMNWPAGTGTLTVSATRLEPNGLFVWVNGLDQTQWSGIPLPAVIPGSTGAPSGTCTLYTDLFFLTVAQASATGTATLTLPLTVTPALHGFVIFTQTLGIDPPANPFGLTTSNLAAQQIIAPWTVPLPVSRIYLLNNLGPTGTVGLTAHLVTKFY